MMVLDAARKPSPGTGTMLLDSPVSRTVSQINIFINYPRSDVSLQQQKTEQHKNIPSGVEVSFLRLDGGASRLMALG
jgi:hypothetical protein